jgi:hypothetical protein
MPFSPPSPGRFLEEKLQVFAGAELQALAWQAAQLVLAVITADAAAGKRWKAENSVSTRRNLGSFITPPFPSGIEEVVAANACRAPRAAGR